jgi:hypothetical protein
MNDKEKYLFYSDEVKEQQRKIEEEAAVLRFLEHLRDRYAHDAGMPVQKEIVVQLTTEYSSDLTIPNKLFIALNQIGSGTVHDVANSLVRLDPSYPQEKALKDARTHLSKFYKKGRINAKQSGKGRGYIYSIKEKP